MIIRYTAFATIVFLGLLTVFPLSGSGSAQEAPLLIAVDNAYPPYMFGGSPARGLYPEIIRAAFSEVGIPVEVVGYPWKRALLLGRRGEAAIGGIYQNLQRLAVFDYSNPLFGETLVVCVRKGHAFPFNGVVDLADKRIGVNRGWSYGEVFDSARRAGLFIAEEAKDNTANLKKLLAGRLDGMIADTFSLAQLLAHQGRTDDVEILPVPAAVNSVHLVLAKSLRMTDVLARFNQGLVAIKSKGIYGRIVDAAIGRADAR